MTDLRYLGARYRLGLLEASALIRIADTLIGEGSASEAAVELWALGPPVKTDAAPLFEPLCVEEGVPAPSYDEASDYVL